MNWPPRLTSAGKRLLWLLYLVGFSPLAPAWAQLKPAELEVRVPHSPQPVTGSDGRLHVAYELHLTNFYLSTGQLVLKQLTVFADEGATPLATFPAAQLPALLAHPLTGRDTAFRGVPIEAGRRVVLFVWLPLPTQGTPVHALRHQLIVESAQAERQVVNGVRTPLIRTPALVLAPPLAQGDWLASEGPGQARSHHWGSVVVANGQTTIPQRYAIDFFGLDRTHHAVTVDRNRLAQSQVSDWSGYGAPVLAVAEGIVRDLRDGEPDHVPLAPLPAPTALTERGLMGNFIVLEIAPQVYVHYAHLRPGSLRVKRGERVKPGTVLGQVGQSGNANAPHLHFQVSTAPTFEESEGVPFVLTRFQRLGASSIGQLLDRAAPLKLKATVPAWQVRQLPLNGDILHFDQ
jgi:murein DD-endopeptidase MepM/ murein hydrolase activator NlpD